MKHVKNKLLLITWKIKYKKICSKIQNYSIFISNRIIKLLIARQKNLIQIFNTITYVCPNPGNTHQITISFFAVRQCYTK